MNERIVYTFKDPGRHIASSEIIRRASTNKEDIREAAFSGLDLSNVRDVLDLGCGFGFMSGHVASKVPSDAFFTGVDACGENGPFFLEAVKSSGREAEFVRYEIADKLPWRDRSFDLVIASYSLYFFAEVIPEIPRVLRRAGMFLTVTHCHDSFSGLYEASGLSGVNTPIAELIDNFSCENGRNKLDPYFKSIESKKYDNTLRFNKENPEDILDYARFKLPLMVMEPGSSDKILGNIARTLSAKGNININKNDIIFRCREPK